MNNSIGSLVQLHLKYLEPYKYFGIIIKLPKNFNTNSTNKVLVYWNNNKISWHSLNHLKKI